MSSAPRVAAIALVVLASAGLAQVQIDDPLKVLDPAPLTKDELKRQKADQLLRDARTRFAIGVIRLRHEQLIEAVAALEKALALDPESLEIRRALAPVYVAVGREDGSMVLCKQVLDREPADAETAFLYARLLRVDGRPAEAIAVLQIAVAGKDAQERPERLLLMLSDLYDLVEKRGDFPVAAKAQDAIIHTINDKREQLLYGNGLTREDLQVNLARAYERLGQARVRTKEYDRAVAAFRTARDVLLKSDDPSSRLEAVRINWNLSEVAVAQERWSDALDALDAYLEHAPAQTEPYERKAELLRKLGREREVVGTIRKYAAREPYHLGLQLLLAAELSKDVRTRGEAETMYTALLEKNVKPEVYRGLFHLYRADGQVTKAIDQLDRAFATAANNDAKADDREAAQDRGRAMLTVLRSDPGLVEALLRDARTELVRGQKREIHTWLLLASLAARTRMLPDAETFFRQCLLSPPPEQEARVYQGLIRVLMLQKKYSDVVTLCQQGLAGRAARNGTETIFHPSLAIALAALGRYDEALSHADKAIQQTSDDWKVDQHANKAEILAQARRYSEAVRECEDTLKEFTRTNQATKMRYALSNVYSLRGDHAKSEEQLRLVLETDPDAPLANNNLGYQMADRNVHLDEAERLIRRAIETDRAIRREADEDGENAAYLDSLGWVLFRQGKLAAAREWLEKAAALPDGADDPTVWDHLGDAYAKLDLPAKAKQAWQTSRKLYDADPRRKGDTRRAEVEKKLKSLDR